MVKVLGIYPFIQLWLEIDEIDFLLLMLQGPEFATIVNSVTAKKVTAWFTRVSATRAK